jgi:predicted RNA-binding Zn-ribbon protein involved in translation (DUF1610 family)
MSNSNYTLNSKINQPRKMTHSEAGRKGAEIYIKNCKIRKAQKIKEYNKDPKLCRQCTAPIAYDKRWYNVFCSQHCRAIFYGSEKSKRLTKQWHCNSCGKAHHSVPFKSKRFCNMRCFNDTKLSKSMQRFHQGLISERNTIKSCLTRLFGYKCSMCGLDHWQGHKLSLEMDHVDGNAGNNMPSNLRLVCPNCHSITPTWKGRNKGSGRASRGLKLF